MNETESCDFREAVERYRQLPIDGGNRIDPDSGAKQPSGRHTVAARRIEEMTHADAVERCGERLLERPWSVHLLPLTVAAPASPRPLASVPQPAAGRRPAR